METFYYVYDYSGRQIRRQWQKEEPWVEARDKGRHGEDPRSRSIGFVGENFHEDVVMMEQKEYDGFGNLIWVYRDTAQSAYFYRPDGMRHEKKGAMNTHEIAYVYYPNHIVYIFRYGQSARADTRNYR